MKPYRHALLLLRRELRLDDNTALLEACRNSDRISLGFILDPRQIGKHRWRSLPGMAFMLESLRLLHDELAGRGSGIHFIKAEASEGLARLVQRTGCDAVFANRDYSPFALKRDAELSTACQAAGIPFHLADDVLLHQPGSILTAQGTPYQVFTPFYRTALKTPVPAPRAFNHWSKLHPMRPEEQTAGRALLGDLHILASPIAAGRDGAIAIVQQLPSFAAYAQQRDIPGLDASTHLSTHLKFGTLSARE
ncbi:MAG: deoxyribodipyrimidine photo-lyase, partial [Mariprofundaceae bacterium]|nr:deoxyribodipyrimidine photo-lyase [Mariprofundaceae bacterium]